MLVLEHRYYGKSQPFSDWSVENLKYLNIENALADIAAFLSQMNSDLVSRYGGKKRKIFVIGGSYPGAVSAWVRYKYPHIIDGALSSSGVVNAVEDLFQYDGQVHDSMLRSGAWCTDTVETLVTYWDDLYFNNKPEYLKQKKIVVGEEVDDREFLEFSQAPAGLVQYGGRTRACQIIKDHVVPLMNDKTKATAEYIKQFQSAFDDESSDNLMGMNKGESLKFRTGLMATKPNSFEEMVKNTTIDFNKMWRQWYYQVCTEVGYFQTKDTRFNMRSKIFTLQSDREQCERVYGKGIIPKTEETNVLFGSVNLKGSNIFFTNGVEDGWRWAGLQEVKAGSPMISEVIDCPDCAHCVELYTEKDSDAQVLKETRQRIRKFFNDLMAVK